MGLGEEACGEGGSSEILNNEAVLTSVCIRA